MRAEGFSHSDAIAVIPEQVNEWVGAGSGSAAYCHLLGFSCNVAAWLLKLNVYSLNDVQEVRTGSAQVWLG